jgi:hypothetical protein
MLVVAALGVGGGLYWAALNPAPEPTVSNTPKPVKTERSGVTNWVELQRGDCIALFDSAWQDSYTLVNCEGAHKAQVLLSADLPRTASYPGADKLARQTAHLCAKKAPVDRTLLDNVPKLLVERNYPPTEEAWKAHPIYQCIGVADGLSFLPTTILPAS